MIFLMHGIGDPLCGLTLGATLFATFQGTSMTIQTNEAMLDASTMAAKPGSSSIDARALAASLRGLSGLRGILTTAQHTLTIFGLSSIAVIVFLVARPDLARQLSISLFGAHAAQPEEVVAHSAPAVPAPITLAAATAAAPPASDAELVQLKDKANNANNANEKQQQWVTSWLSKRYRVAGDAANMLVSTAYSTAHEIKLDPLLILAVMAIESGLNPFAESPMGAQGLMQVMAKVHHDKFQSLGGVQAALNPAANIRVGSQILKDYVTRGGSVEAGLKTYVGAAAFENDSGYGYRVLAEYNRLKQVSNGRKVPTSTPIIAAAPTPAAASPAPGAPSATHETTTIIKEDSDLARL
jgi:soluble lytic murein transglycosylase-like protein